MSLVRRGALVALLFAATGAGPGCIQRQAAEPPPAPARGDTALLDDRRIAALPAEARSAWMAYLARSRDRRALDREAMARELASVGRDRMTRAPHMREAFELRPHMTDAWFASDSAARMAEIVLSFQTPSGGWSKHVDMTQRPRQAGESWFSESDGWSYIATIDNGATVGQLLFLSRAFQARGNERYRDAFVRGIDYLLAAQFPNGCWPQVYPLQGGYHDAATFNDDAIVNVLRLFRDIGRDRHPFVPPEVRGRAAEGLARGVDCIIASQVIVDGRRTAWGQQHDPLTLAPVAARSYEPASLSGRESAGIAGLLMTLRDPDARVVQAVHAVAGWFRKTAIYGYAYDFEKGLSRKEGAGPIWARMYEIGTDRPIFSNRDGIVLYDWNQLTDRRTGYGWYGEEPAGALDRYETWSRRYSRIDDASSGSP